MLSVRKPMTLALILGFLILAGSALAAWNGQNGVVRFSFVEGPELQPVAHVPAGENGITMVDLYAWLTDVVPLERDGEVFTGTAGFELALTIEGAEAFITKQEYLQPCREVGQGKGKCIVGLDPGLDLDHGRAQLVHWQIMFQGEVKDVVFRLDPAGLFSCERVEGCEGSGVSVLYVGTRSTNFVGEVFGAGYQPAYLNPTGETDLTDINGTSSWQDVGRFVKH